MNSPVTTLDQRYSDPAASAVGWDETSRLLGAAELFWLTTVRVDGRPHVTPVVAVWVDDVLHFATGSEEQKFANLRANPHVVMTTGCNRWDGGIDVVVEGQAVQVADEGVLTRVAEAFAAKWAGAWQYVVRDGRFCNEDADFPVELFAVTPTRAFSHSKGHPFGATTHRF